jgi:propanediol dehydratase large subunit
MSIPDIISSLKFAFFLAVASNDGANLGATNVLIEVTVKAWDRDPFSSVSSRPAIPRPISSLNGSVVDLDEEEKVDLELLARALRRLKLMHDVEPNPGPGTDIYGLG